MTDHPDDPIAAVLADVVPPGHERQGNHGHDQAMDRASGAQLLRWRAARMTYAQIAEVGGYANESSARQALLRALDRHEAENAAQLRAIENAALDSDERALQKIILDDKASWQAKVAAVNARTRISNRRSQLNGLDAPKVLIVSPEVREQYEQALAAVRDIVAGEVVEPRESDAPEAPPALEA